MKKNIILTLLLYFFIISNSNGYYSNYNINLDNTEQEKYFQILIEEKNKKIKLLEENIEKVLEDYRKLDTNDFKSFSLNKVENIFNNFKKLLDEDIIVKNSYNSNLEKIEKTLNDKKDFDNYQEYLKNGDKYNLTNLKDWKDFTTKFKELKDNKEQTKKEFEYAKDLIKKGEVYYGLNIYKNICNKVKLFECDYETSKYYKQEMIGYSEIYHSSNKKENFEKYKKEAIKYLESAIYNYKKDLFLEEIDILKIEKELQEIKNYEFIGNKENNISQKKDENKKEKEENKIVNLFFQKLNELTKNYSENNKREFYKNLKIKLNKIKNKSSNIILNKNIDEIILRLEK